MKYRAFYYNFKIPAGPKLFFSNFDGTYLWRAIDIMLITAGGRKAYGVFMSGKVVELGILFPSNWVARK